MTDLDKYPTAKFFIDRFLGYVTGRERDHTKLVQGIFLTEWALKNQKELLVELLLGKLAKKAYRLGGKEDTIFHMLEWLRCKVATDKLLYYRMGLLKPTRHGDLRTARWVTKEREQFFALIRLKKTRKDPRTIAYMQQELRRAEPEFLLRLGNALKRPALEFKHIKNSVLQDFLLKYWNIGHLDKNGQPVPGLCECSDPMIAKLAGIFGIQHNLSPAVVKKTWQRLGLNKSPRIGFYDVWKIGPKIVFSQLRPRS